MSEPVTLYSAGAQPEEAFDDGYFQRPLEYFRRIRERTPAAPVLTHEGRAWVVTRYADVRAAFTDPRLVKDFRKLVGPDWVPDPVAGFLNEHMLNSDPPDHTRLRRLVQKAFTPGRVAALRPRVEAITGGLLDAMTARASAGDQVVDLIEAFAFPLPITVICELLGIPDGDREEFKAWSQVIVSSEATGEEFRAVGSAMGLYFVRMIAAKRERPGDLLSALITARDDGDSLSDHELLAMIFLLLVAGFETTVNLIASGVLALLTFPAELARLRADPSLLPRAVEELLRFANPLDHALARYTVEPTEIGGVTIPAGEVVLLVTSAANHDPARFAAPDALDLDRDSSGHLAFGHGIHYCLGAPLARLEGEVAFGALLSRFPSLSLAADPASLRWRPSSLIHGLETLPVRLR